MEGILDFICLRQFYFYGNCRSTSKVARSKLRNITSKSYFKPTKKYCFNNGHYCNCSGLYHILFVLFNFCLALRYKHHEKLMGASRKAHNFNKFCLDFLESIYRLRLFSNVLFQPVILQHVQLRKNLTSGSNRSLRSLGRAKARPLTKRYVHKESGFVI